MFPESCFGSDIELHMWKAQRIMLRPCRGVTLIFYVCCCIFGVGLLELWSTRSFVGGPDGGRSLGCVMPETSLIRVLENAIWLDVVQKSWEHCTLPMESESRLCSTDTCRVRSLVVLYVWHKYDCLRMNFMLLWTYTIVTRCTATIVGKQGGQHVS